jgi:hypothetical protein
VAAGSFREEWSSLAGFTADSAKCLKSIRRGQDVVFFGNMWRNTTCELAQAPLISDKSPNLSEVRNPKTRVWTSKLTTDEGCSTTFPRTDLRGSQIQDERPQNTLQPAWG